jgi:hypothetical protein
MRAEIVQRWFARARPRYFVDDAAAVQPEPDAGSDAFLVEVDCLYLTGRETEIFFVTGCRRLPEQDALAMVLFHQIVELSA